MLDLCVVSSTIYTYVHKVKYKILIHLILYSPDPKYTKL